MNGLWDQFKATSKREKLNTGRTGRVLVKVTEGAERNDYIRLALQFLDEFHEEMAQNLAI